MGKRYWDSASVHFTCRRHRAAPLHGDTATRLRWRNPRCGSPGSHLSGALCPEIGAYTHRLLRTKRPQRRACEDAGVAGKTPNMVMVWLETAVEAFTIAPTTELTS
jgi:hypothetical protein